MPFFTFHQNNSYGVFEDPAEVVIVEASDYNMANALACSYGIYFDDEYAIDCECCGRRWHRVDEYDADDEPSIYGTPVLRYAPLSSRPVLIVYADGTKVKLTLTR